jgi:nucleolar pre-ribosomal-associated protein 1
VLKSGLLPWIEMQLVTNVKVSESVAWLKILHNVMALMDPVKLDAATYGEWRSVVCRCCQHLVEGGIACSFPRHSHAGNENTY